MRKEDIKYIVVHCSATREDQDYTEQDLDRDHRARGFSRAGYHYYVRKDGSIHFLRREDEMGAHCKAYNRVSLGICYEGGLSIDNKAKDTRNTAQKDAMFYLIKMLASKYPKATVLGHSDLSRVLNNDGRISENEWQKYCPSFDAKEEYKHIRQKPWTRRLA